MISVTYYITATGEISGGKTFEDDVIVSDITVDRETTESFVYGEGDGTREYISGGVITPRPQIIVDDDFLFLVDGDNTISVDFVLPTGTIVTDPDGVDSAASTAAEHFQFKAARGGEFTFTLTPPFPYKEERFTVTANAL